MKVSDKRDNCISCGFPLGPDVVDIGEQYPSAIFPEIDSAYRDELEKTSLNVAKCTRRECGLVQLSNEYDLDVVFENYPFVSGTTATMIDILTSVLQEGLSHVELSENDAVLDIGGNDGTMLAQLSQPLLARVNIDAAHGVKSIVDGGNYTRIQGKFSSDLYHGLGLPAPKLIFSVAMFYHLSDPISFSKQVEKIMSNDSVWVLQMTYLGSMLDSNIYDNIVHEHVAYYSLQSLEYLLSQVGLEVFSSKVVKSYGGSIRACIRKKGASVGSDNGNNADVKAYEVKSGINSLVALERFNERAQLLKKVTHTFLKHISDIEGGILALGASTKGNMICQFLGLDKSIIKGALDNNEKKIGLSMTGSDIPILDEDSLLVDVPKYLLVLPYYYIDFFVKMIGGKLRSGQVCYLIVPLPEPYVITVEG
ncbi:MAG: methyltransferase domain-containing protein [Proteobacteria bacterium]|nr:methyltransferase domain-containing protein [Pseudomonadota bacterium]